MPKNENDPNVNNENIRAYYNGIWQQLLNLHDTIWEEIKHFTWLLSLLLSAPFIFLLNQDGEKLFFRYGWIPTLAAFIIAIIASIIIYRESLHFLSFSYYLHRAEWMLGLYGQSPILKDLGIQDPHFVPKHRRQYFMETDSCDEYVRRNNRFRISSIRWLFIILFFVYGAVGFILAGCILTHNILGLAFKILI